MKAARLEHANITVSDPERTAKMLGDIFGWHVRWQGEAIAGGHTVHVGSDDTYLAIYQQLPLTQSGEDSYTTIGGLNHLALVVDDIHAAKKRVIAAGYTPGEHFDYEPGERFYFDDHDGIEFEVVCYP